MREGYTLPGGADGDHSSPLQNKERQGKFSLDKWPATGFRHSADDARGGSGGRLIRLFGVGDSEEATLFGERRVGEERLTQTLFARHVVCQDELGRGRTVNLPYRCFTGAKHRNAFRLDLMGGVT